MCQGRRSTRTLWEKVVKAPGQDPESLHSEAELGGKEVEGVSSVGLK